VRVICKKYGNYKSEKDYVEYYNSINKKITSPNLIYSLAMNFWDNERESYSLLVTLKPLRQARRGWGVDTMPRALYPFRKTQYFFYRSWVGPRAELDRC
jgi:hypothetical protein